MPQIKITYQAFGKIDVVTFPYHTPIGNVHDHLFDLCNTYRIINIETTNPEQHAGK